MSRLEQFIVRHRAARYAFVLISWPITAVADRARGVSHPVDRHGLRTALGWARRGGDPAERRARPEPAPISARWRDE